MTSPRIAAGKGMSQGRLSVMGKQIILVTGPARSGKSEWSEALATQSGKGVIYVATSQVDPADLEWQARIERHQRRRPATWETIHSPQALGKTILQGSDRHCLLVDSLGTWLANQLTQEEDAWQRTEEELFACLSAAQSTIILVAEETGWGVVPAYPLGRTFRDRLGHLTRRVGAIADTVYLVTAGYVLNLSVLGTPLPLPSLPRSE
jgi:adenosylcobinamide kinase/adenosylcobinamide-phosphate guanylyltransferase